MVRGSYEMKKIFLKKLKRNRGSLLGLLRPPNTELEDGSAVNYVSYFVAISLTCIMFVVFKFRMDVLVAKEICETGLHVVETGALTANHNTLGSGALDAGFENEMERTHIIPAVTNSNTTSDKERLQVNTVGSYIQGEFADQFALTGVTHPTGHLAMLCGDDSDVLISTMDGTGGVVKIYEPIYKYTITKRDSGETITFPNGTTITKWVFETNYSIDAWLEYDLTFANNQYTGFTKKTLASAPQLYNGDTAEGATIESTVNIEFNGIRKVIATNPSDGFFESNPTSDHYSVKVTQAMDIVISKEDSRRK